MSLVDPCAILTSYTLPLGCKYLTRHSSLALLLTSRTHRSALDLPYNFGANDNEMSREQNFNFQDDTGPIDLAYDRPKKKTRTPEEEKERQKRKKKKAKQLQGKPPEQVRDAPISNITEPQKRANSAPPPPPPKNCCVIL